MRTGVDLWVSESDSSDCSENRSVRKSFSSRNAVQERLPPDWRYGSRWKFIRRVLTHHGILETPEKILGRTAASSDSGSFGVSFSDSGSYFAVAICRSAPLGIDLERVRPIDEIKQTLSRLGLDVLSGEIMRLPVSQRAVAFLHIWTAFEAYLKLERAAWDIGARQFQSFENRWRVNAGGSVEFQSGVQSGPNFVHLLIENRLIICVATPHAEKIKLNTVETLKI